MEPGLEAHKAYDPPPMTFSNAMHVCEVSVDVRTGKVRLSGTSWSRIAETSSIR